MKLGRIGSFLIRPLYIIFDHCPTGYSSPLPCRSFSIKKLRLSPTSAAFYFSETTWILKVFLGRVLGHKNSCTIDTISIAQRSYITFIMLFSLLMPLPADPDRRIPLEIRRIPPRQRAHRRQCQYIQDSAQPTEQL